MSHLRSKEHLFRPNSYLQFVCANDVNGELKTQVMLAIHEICQKNSATTVLRQKIMPKNAYFATFATSLQKCVNYSGSCFLKKYDTIKNFRDQRSQWL